MHKKFLLLIVLSFLLLSLCSAQNVAPKGNFLVDSLKIGENIPYALSLQYPKGMHVVFPDSTYDFSPFEYVRRAYFTTRSDTTYSFDSTIYYLTTFEIDTIQRLSLPVFIIKDGDSIPISTAEDSVFLIELVPVVSDTLALKEDTKYRKVNLAVNYPLLTAILVALLVIAVILIIIFGKQIQQKITIYRLRRAHKRFLVKYEKLMAEYKEKPEKLLLFWKDYLEDIEKKPYTKYTTKEIIANHQNGTLETSLKSIDRVIYSERYTEDLKENFMFLLDFATSAYEEKIKKVMHD